MQAPGEEPIFYDASHKRWPWVRGAFLAVSFAVFVLLICLSISITINPVLPGLGLPGAEDASQGPQLQPPTATQPALPQAAKARAFRAARRHLMEARKKEAEEGLPPRRAQPLQAGSTAPSKALAMAFFVQENDMALSALKQNAGNLDVLLPIWLRLLPEGKVEPLGFAKQMELSAYLRSTQPELKIVPLLSNESGKGWDGLAACAPPPTCFPSPAVGRRSFAIW